MANGNDRGSGGGACGGGGGKNQSEMLAALRAELREVTRELRARTGELDAVRKSKKLAASPGEEDALLDGGAKRRKPCFAFGTLAGCRFGDSCRFAHEKGCGAPVGLASGGRVLGEPAPTPAVAGAAPVGTAPAVAPGRAEDARRGTAAEAAAGRTALGATQSSLFAEGNPAEVGLKGHREV